MNVGKQDRIKALSTRAKKMVAKLDKIPRAEFFTKKFAEKGEKISKEEAKVISKNVRDHRKGVTSAPKKEKRQKVSHNHGF
jgi:hypothetical protein